MAADDGDFLRRWSRRKRQAEAAKSAPAQPAASPPPDAQAPKLPPVDSLTFESDFKDFMHETVEEGVRRAALKKLFADPRFNVIDGLDVYADDYSNLERLSEEVAARLAEAQTRVRGALAETEAAEETPADAPGDAPAEAQAKPEAPQDVAAASPETKKDDGSQGQDA